MRISLKYLFQHSCLILMTALTFGCVSAPIKPSADEVRLFTDASPMVGQKVLIRGYLRYEFENMNLFPTDNAKLGLVRKSCLPVLIKRQNEGLIDAAYKLNGSLVVISGTIANANAGVSGMVSATNCKQIGIDADSINRL